MVGGCAACRLPRIWINGLTSCISIDDVAIGIGWNRPLTFSRVHYSYVSYPLVQAFTSRTIVELESLSIVDRIGALS